MDGLSQLGELPLPDGGRLEVDGSDKHLTLMASGEILARVHLEPIPSGLRVTLLQYPHEQLPEVVRQLGYWLFAANPECLRLEWQGLPDHSPGLGQLYRQGLLMAARGASAITHRSAFWQVSGPWLRGGSIDNRFPEVIVKPGDTRHPVRPPKPMGEVYRRFDARLGSWISFRTLDISADLERFNRWQNTPRVEAFWEEGGSLEAHCEHLERLVQDPHCLQLIGCFDDEPFGFFDAYWAREDRIGPYCDAGFYDRGIHMLVGEQDHRGPHKVASWLPSLVHFLLLDEPRTGRIVSEPRADNERMIHHLQRVGFCREREFDFPHKRAALMTLSRECFFDRCALC